MKNFAVSIAGRITWNGKTIFYGKLDGNWKDVILVNAGEEETKKTQEGPESK